MRGIKVKFRYAAVMCIFFLLFSCAEKRLSDKTPPGIIKPDKMVDILCDLHIAESGLEHKGFYGDSLDIYINDYYFAIFQKYGISKEKYIKSINFYLENPYILEIIYRKVTERFEQLNSEKWD